MYLRKKLKHAGPLFVFCGSGFSPTPDQTLIDLYDVRNIFLKILYMVYNFYMLYRCFMSFNSSFSKFIEIEHLNNAKNKLPMKAIPFTVLLSERSKRTSKNLDSDNYFYLSSYS